MEQEKNSPLERVAMQRFQGPKQTTVTGAKPLLQVPSVVVLAIDGIKFSCDPLPIVSTVATKRFSPPLPTLLIPPTTVSFPAVVLGFAFLSPFLLSCLSFAFAFPFLLSFLSSLSFAVPHSLASIHTNQEQTRLHQNRQQWYSPLQFPLTALEEGKFFVSGTCAG